MPLALGVLLHYLRHCGSSRIKQRPLQFHGCVDNAHLRWPRCCWYFSLEEGR